MKTKNYIFLIIVSLVMTSVMFLKLCEGVTPFGMVLCDFIAMIGGGILCSTIVSCIIEVRTKRKEKLDKEEQRKYILASVRNRFIRLFEREMFGISLYYDKHISENLHKWETETFSVRQIGAKLVWLLNEIQAEEEKERQSDVIITIDLKKIEEQRKFLISSSEIYYESLLQSLLEMDASYNMYLISGLLNEHQIEVLRDLARDIQDVLLCTPEECIDDGTVLEFKKILFEKASQYCAVFDILDDEKVRVQYKNVFPK